MARNPIYPNDILDVRYGQTPKSPTHQPAIYHNPFSSTSPTKSYSWGGGTSDTKLYTPTKRVYPHNLDIIRKRDALPIHRYKSQIIDRIRKSQVIVIEGETGSGKSTQIPQWCCELENVSHVVCTQPRRIAATSLAIRVSQEMGVKLGEEVGYEVRFDHKSCPSTTLKYVTDGILLRQLMTNNTLDGYNIVVIDEVHERRVTTDVLIGLIKRLLPVRTELKVVIMSATLNTRLFSDFFGGCDHLRIPGKIYPIEVIYSPSVLERTRIEEKDKKRFENYVSHAINLIMDICISEKEEGDILVFVTGRDEIDFICDNLEDLLHSSGHIDVIPLFGELPYSSQQRIFAPPPKTVLGKIGRKCIVATNIAETSITIDGIVFVIDSGRVKLSSVSNSSHMKSLLPVLISQSSAVQRAGRAGRTRPGKCYRLYDKAVFDSMAKDTLPEILRSDLTNIILHLKVIGINLHTFESIDQPNPDAMKIALENLHLLNAINPVTNEVTGIGHSMARFPVDCEISRMLVASYTYSCQYEILTLAAMLSGDRPGSVFILVGKKNRERADQLKGQFTHPSGDHLTYINVYNKFQENGYSEYWCHDTFVNFKMLNEARTIREQLSKIMLELKLITAINYIPPKAPDSNILMAILTGNMSRLAQKNPLDIGTSIKQQYLTVKNDLKVTLHPSCALNSQSKNYELLCYTTCIKTNPRQSYISTVSCMEVKWYQDVARATGAPPLPTRAFPTINLAALSIGQENPFLNNPFQHL